MSATYASWFKLHAELMSFLNENELNTLKAWSALFKEKGYTPDELCSASKNLALKHATRYRMEHPTLIAEFIENERLRERSHKRMLQDREQSEKDRKDAEGTDYINRRGMN